MAQEMLQAREHKESQAHVMLSHVNLDTAIKPVNRTTMKASRKRKGAACSGDAPIQEYNNTVNPTISDRKFIANGNETSNSTFPLNIPHEPSNCTIPINIPINPLLC